MIRFQSKLTLYLVVPALLVSCTQATVIEPELSAITSLAAPEVSSVTPASGAFTGGTILTIRGSGFLPGVQVKVGAQTCQDIQRVATDEIRCVTPAGTIGTVSITVTNADSQNFTLSSAFSYVDTVHPVPGIAVVSGGGISSSPTLRAIITIGEPTTATLQTTSQALNLTGMQAVSSE